MKVLKLSVVAIIAIVLLLAFVWPLPTEAGEYASLDEAVREHKEVMMLSAMFTALMGLVILFPIAISSNDTFGKYFYAIAVSLLLFSYFTENRAFVYISIILIEIVILLDILALDNYGEDEFDYERRVKNRVLNRVTLDNKKKSLYKANLGDLRTRKRRKHKERV